MTKAQEVIVEILGSRGGLHLINALGDRLEYSEKISGDMFNFGADYYEQRDGSYEIEIDFSRSTPGSFLATMSQVPSDQKTAMRVFSTAVSFTKSVVHYLENVSQISFSAHAEETSRVNLYRKIANIIAKLSSIPATIKTTDRGVAILYIIKGKWEG